MNNLIIYGGTFDPIHCGHLTIARHIQTLCHFDRFVFLPCQQNILKNRPSAPAANRVHMIELGLNEYNLNPDIFKIDTREIIRQTPSYMVKTLEDFRAELGNELPITLLLGADCLKHLSSWYQWQKLITLGNLLIIDRPHSATPDKSITTFLKPFVTGDLSTLLTKTKKYVCFYNAGRYDISSTNIRHAIKSNDKKHIYLPKTVFEYIKIHQLYC